VPVPAPPTNVLITQVGSSASVSWTAATYATSYIVNFFRHTTNSITAGTNYDSGSSSTTSLSRPMDTSTIYFYYATVSASNSTGTSSSVKTPYAISYGSGCVTIAGSPGIFGTVNGYGDANRYYIPLFGSIDTDGNLYITSAYANVIQKLTTPGCQGSTFSPTTTIASPRGSVVYNGFLYVCDGSSVKRMSLSGGSATTFAATVPGATYITSDGAGGFYVSTQNDGILYQINSSGGVSQRTISGYNYISGIAFHPPTGDIYFSSPAPGTTSSRFARLPAGSSTAVLIQGGNDFSSGVKMNYNNTAVYYSVTNDCTVRKYIIANGAIISIVGSVNDNRHIDSLIMSNVRINNAYDIILMNDGLGMYILDQGGAAQTVRRVIFGDDPPPAPTNVQLSYNIGDTTMSVSYGTVTGATSYSGEFYSTTLDSSGNVATSTATSVQGPTTLSTTSLTSTFSIVRNRYYYAIIKSTNANGSSASRSPIVYSGLDSPTGVTMASYTSGATSISVSWNSVPGATSYTVNFYVSGNATPVQTFTSVTSLSQVSSFALATNNTYYASVCANNISISSDFLQSSNTVVTASSFSMGTLASGITFASVVFTAYSGNTYSIKFYSNTNNPTTTIQTNTLPAGSVLYNTVSLSSGNTGSKTMNSINLLSGSTGRYYFAVIDVSNTSDSSIITFYTQTAVYYYIPNQISGLLVWLDAQDSTTYTLSGTALSGGWRDKKSNLSFSPNNGGSANPVAGSVAPYITGSGQNIGMYFDNPDNIQDSNSVGIQTNLSSSPLLFPTQNLTVITVSTDATTNSDSDELRCLLLMDDAITGGIPNLGIFYHTTAQEGLSIQHDYDGSDWGRSILTNLPSVNYNKQILCGTSSSSKTTLHQNGNTLVNNTTVYNSPYTNYTINRLGIASNNNGHRDWGGTVHEIMIYNVAISDTQRQIIEGWLAWKWGTQSSLNGGHPYASASP
jgi:hypothetical protein